jgi:DNA polymerase-3 subunit delta
MLHVFYGPDQFRAREEVRLLRQELDREGNLAHNTVRLEGRGLSIGELRSACHSASFFAEDRLVIVEGLQERFSGVRRRGRAPARGSGASDLDGFADVLTNLPETTTVVLLDEQPSGAFLDAIGSNAKVREFPILRNDALRQWAVLRARAQGASFSPAALDRLTSMIDGYHLGELAHEIDKLATYANGRTVEVTDIDALVSGAIQYQIWDLTDAVIAGRADRALGFVETMAARGGRDYAPGLLIYMLTRQYRQLILAKALKDGGATDAQVGQHLGISQPFPLRKIIEQCGRYSVERLETAYRRLLETDVAVKTGVLEVDTALELLIADLSELAKAPRRPAPTRR